MKVVKNNASLEWDLGYHVFTTIYCDWYTFLKFRALQTYKWTSSI